MRLVSFVRGGAVHAGVLVDGGVVAAGEGGVGELLRRGGLPVESPPVDPIPLDSVQLLPPVVDPSKIVCLGLNYRSHAAEAGLDAPEVPAFFAKWPHALAAPGADVPLPAYSQKVDYEAEVAFVIGRRCRDVPQADALDV